MKVKPEKLRIVNCCPHEVTVVSGSIFDPSVKKNRGGTPTMRIPPSGYIASAQSEIVSVEPTVVDGVSIPTCERRFISVDKLPDDDRLYIVSSVYAQAAEELGERIDNLRTPHGSVVDNRGRVVGCVGFVQYRRKEEAVAG